jgi:hypothetical protein
MTNSEVRFYRARSLLRLDEVRVAAPNVLRLFKTPMHAHINSVYTSTEVALLGRFDDSVLDVTQATPTFDACKDARNPMSLSGCGKLFDT